MSTRRKLPARPKEQKSSKPDKATAKPTKRTASKPVNATLASLKPDIFVDAAIPPARTHASSYHYPLLLNEEGDGGEACGKLLEWFEGIEGERDMPWRKDWIDPESFVGKLGGDDEGVEKILARRAYEVWVSEISEWILPFSLTTRHHVLRWLLL
jgi:A/G-specific adenine glycosylase